VSDTTEVEKSYAAGSQKNLLTFGGQKINR
jgi:hypothetical protein